MVTSTTKLNRNEDLIELLASEDAALRMLALHILCEGYATSPEILAAVFRGWDCWGEADAYPEFPMLSHIPIEEAQISEILDRASKMVQDRKLTEPATRCAGKLIEQVVRLPARQLLEHLGPLRDLCQTSKIFFRVDLDSLQERILLLDRSGDQLAAVLDDAIARLVKNEGDGAARQQGLAALESLRREHPEYLDLTGVFRSRQNLLSAEGEAPQPSPSFQITLQSLVEFEQPEIENQLAPHLWEASEGVYSSAVEALVRAGTREAALVLLEQLASAPVDNQKWIARGLQRFRTVGLSPKIAELREHTTDPRLWLMLLIAEVRQFEHESAARVGRDLARVQSFSETLMDSLRIYVRLNHGSPAGRQVALALDDYRKRTEPN